MNMLALALALTAQTAAPPPMDVTSEREATIRQRVADELRDPPSAYFRDVELRQHREGGQAVICGYVAGRNGHGGMGDPMGFAITASGQPQLFKTSDDDARVRGMALQMRDVFCGDRWTRAVRPLDWNK